MLGLLITFLMAIGAVGLGRFAFGRFMTRLDPAEQLGVSGLIGLGMTGLSLLFVGILPQGLTWGVWAVVGLLVLGFILGKPWEGLTGGKSDTWAYAALSIIILLVLQAAVGALAPSTMMDWDSLAYHLAVPQRWLDAGQIGYVPALHHSNFPFTVDNLFILGLKFGGEPGAKAFMLCFMILGSAAVFGLVKRWAGAAAGWTAALGFVGIPIVAWESGTAYIDAAHGLYAALAVAYAIEAFCRDAEDEDAPSVTDLTWLAIAAAGFCMGSKFTGLQVMAGLVGILVIGGLVKSRAASGAKIAATVCLGGLLLASPWFIKTVVYTGNPVYPFFYSILGGKEWDQWRADIYAEEQATFGVPKSPLNLGHAVLGLGYQPGRYVNPGQQEGAGFPSGAVGFGVVFALIAALVSGRMTAREKMIAGYVAIGLAMWFLLSQQSRYLTILAIPAVIAAAACSSRIKMPLVQGAFATQALATLAILSNLVTLDQLPVALGSIPKDEWQKRRVPTARVAEQLNELPAGTQVALYDDVFGFLIRHKTFWANPGHSTLIDHAGAKTGGDLVNSLKSLGITHVFVNLQFMDAQPTQLEDGTQGSSPRDRWLESAGFKQGGPYTEKEKEALWADLRNKWKWLTADAARSGAMKMLYSTGRGFVFEIPKN